MEVHSCDELVTIVGNAVIAFIHGAEVSLDTGGPPRGMISGKLVPLPIESERVWVRLQGIFADSKSNSQVDRAGRFILRGVAPGLYMLTVLKNGSVLTAVPLSYTGPSAANVTIDIAPEAIRVIQAQ